MSIRTPIHEGILQSDLDCAGFDLLNFSGGGGGGGGFQYDVTQYGATGDGTTDDGDAIRAALAAIPSTGGLLYFPAGIYKYTGTTLALNKPVTVQGDGGGAGGLSDLTGITTPAITQINFNSATVPLFTVTADGCAFRELELYNSSVTEPSAGAGVLVSSNGDKTNFQNLTVNGFYICVDIQSGIFSRFDNCLIVSPVLYGIKTRNIGLPDGGDHCISNSWFFSGRYLTPTAGLRIESAGGLKVMNCKFVNLGPGVFVNGIDLSVADGVSTVDLLITNCSIENYSGAAIKGRSGTGSHWYYIVITGNQIAPGATGSKYAIDFNDTHADGLGTINITGNVAVASASTHAMIELTNTTNVCLTGNLQTGFTSMVSAGTGVTFTDVPVYIGRDARLVAISSGVKLECRNTGTDTWVEATRYTNP